MYYKALNICETVFNFFLGERPPPRAVPEKGLKVGKCEIELFLSPPAPAN